MRTLRNRGTWPSSTNTEANQEGNGAYTGHVQQQRTWNPRPPDANTRTEGNQRRSDGPENNESERTPTPRQQPGQQTRERRTLDVDQLGYQTRSAHQRYRDSNRHEKPRSPSTERRWMKPWPRPIIQLHHVFFDCEAHQIGLQGYICTGWRMKQESARI